MGQDEGAYRRLMTRLVADGGAILRQVLGPFRLPERPALMLRFGWLGLRSARGFAESTFREQRVRGLFAGLAAHAILPLENWLTAAVGLMFGITAHHGGWPLPQGGSRRIALALEQYLRSLGGEIVTGQRVGSLADLPPCKAVLFDVSPRHLCRIAGDALPASYQRQLMRGPRCRDARRSGRGRTGRLVR
jgi:phytoene dehydrogenase-like protein